MSRPPRYDILFEPLKIGPVTAPNRFYQAVSQLRRGVLDLIGAARPSIADPFLPMKIREGRFEDIHECIGCNVCISGENSYAPIRCTQNPTIMEEGRRGWHPERVSVRGSNDRILIVGGGPAGLECALTLGRRGYDVVLAEGTDEFGGRVSRESRLPGLVEWARVRDYRINQLQRLSNIQLFRQSPLDSSTALDFGAERFVIATGARWRRDGIGRACLDAIPGHGLSHVMTPDDIMDGRLPRGHVLIYDTDGTYFGNVIAELLRDSGASVTLVTSAAETAAYLALTLEQTRVIRRLLHRGVIIVRLERLAKILPGGARLTCVYGGPDIEIAGDNVVLITQRQPQDSLYLELANAAQELATAGTKSVHRIGDCNAPNIIATAVYVGHRYARELDEPALLEVAHFPE